MIKKIASFIIVWLFVLTVFTPAITIFIQNQNNSPETIPHYEPIRPALAAEQDTIDSFNVNPANRWNLTTSGSGISSSIVSSNLLVKNQNNGSTSNSYTANRGLSKTDSKVEWRSQSDVSGNTSEYFRDQLGTPMNFDSSTQGWITKGTSTITQSNGMLKVIESSSNGGVRYNSGQYISKNVYTNISFDIYASSSLTVYIQVYYFDTGFATLYGNYYTSHAVTTSTQNINVPFSSFTGALTRENTLFNRIEIYPTASFTGSYYIDNIQLLGSYNYPTMNLNQNWGFDSSKEYFYDSLGNISNFEDGTTEGWSCYYTVIMYSCPSSGTASWSNLNNEYGFLDRIYGKNVKLTRNDLSVSASTYKYFLLELYTNDSFGFGSLLKNITVYDSSNNLLATITSGIAENQWFLATATLNPTYWTGTETNLTIVFNADFNSNNRDYLIKFIGLYDSDKGNTENWSPTNAYSYVDPQGYLVSHVTSTTGPYVSTPTISVDTSLYRYLTVRVKASITGQTINIFDNAFNLLGQIGSISTAFTTYIIDLQSASTFWTSTKTNLHFYFYNTTGRSPLDTVFTIDYILLTAAPQQQQPFQLGFVNPTSFQPVLNVTQIYLNSSAFYWQINLYDQYGSIVAYYDSAIQTAVVSGYAAVDDSLYVNGFDSSTLGWKLVGSSPYLNAIDSSYIDNLLTNLNTINFGTGLLSNASTSTSSLTASLVTPTNSHWYKSGTFSVAVTASVGYTAPTYTGIDAGALLNFSIGSVSNSTSLITSLNQSSGLTVSWYKSFTFSVAVNASSSTPTNYTTTNTLYLDVSTDGGTTWLNGISSAVWSNNATGIKTLSDSSTRYTWLNKLMYRLRDVQTGNGSAVLTIYSTTENQATYKYQIHYVTSNTLYLDVSTNGGGTWTTGLDSFTWTTNDTSVSHTFSDSASYDITNNYLAYRLRLVQTGNGTDGLSITSTTETQATYTYIPLTATEGWFSFTNETSSHTSGYTTTINVYLSAVSIGDQLQWQIDTNNDGLADCYGTVTNPVSGWNSITPSLTCLDTKTEINNARLSVTSLGTIGHMQINAAYLGITHTSTIISSPGWGGFYRGKIDYSIVQSSLSVELDTDSSTKIFKATYPDSFTVSNQINALFALTTYPTIYFSMTTPGISYSETYLDFINAPFAESKWFKSTSPGFYFISPGSNIDASPTVDILYPSVNSGSFYEMDIPLLDSLTGSLVGINSNGTIGAGGGSYINSYFDLYMVDPATGTQQIIFMVNLYRDISRVYMYFYVGCNHYSDPLTCAPTFSANYATTTMYDSQIDFNVKLLNARQTLTVDLKTTEDISSSTPTTKANSYSIDLNSLYGASHYSQEFVAEYGVNANLVTATGYFTYRLDNYGYQTRDIFQDAIVAIVNAGGGIFAPLFQGLANALGSILAVVGRYLAQIFNLVGGSIIAGIITGLPATVASALAPLFISLGTTINNYLGPLLNTVSSAVNSVTTAIGSLANNIASSLSGYFDNIVSAITDLADKTATAIWGALVDGVNKYVNPLVSAIIDELSVLVNPIWGLIASIIAVFWTGLGWLINQLYNGFWSIYNIFAGFIASEYDTYVPALLRGWGAIVWNLLINLPAEIAYLATIIILTVRVYIVVMTILIGILYIKDKYMTMNQILSKNMNPLADYHVGFLTINVTIPRLNNAEIYGACLFFLFTIPFITKMFGLP